MRQLRGDVDAAMASGRHWSLLVQRVWLVLQDERTEQATHQAETAAGEYHTTRLLLVVEVSAQSMLCPLYSYISFSLVLYSVPLQPFLVLLESVLYSPLWLCAVRYCMVDMCLAETLIHSSYG
jgi:hypothetical protein